MSKHIQHSVNKSSEAHFEIILRQRGQGLSSIPIQKDCIKLLYVLRGQLLVTLNNKSYSVNPGDLFIILADESHTITTASKSSLSFWEIIYSKELLYTASHSVSNNKFLFSFMISGRLGQRLFTRDVLVQNHIPNLIENILGEHENPEYFSDVFIRLQICQLSLYILRSWKNQDEESALTSINDIYSVDLLQKVFTFVEQEYMNKIKMETIAKQCNMSYHSFSKFFIAHTGKSFTSYVNDVRLTKSKILLTTTGMNITEIAMEVGYLSTSHFIQRFKESNQMTPQQFRKEFNK